MNLLKCLGRCKGCCGPIPQRYVTTIIAAMGLGFVYILRNSFSLALTEMVIQESDTSKENNSIDRGLECPIDEEEVIRDKERGEFSWTSNEFQYLLSAYFIGYTIAHLPGGILGDHVGAKVVLNTGLFIGGVCSLLTPTSARLHYAAIFFVRIIMGLGHGVIFPALSTLISAWSPPNERSVIAAITYSGITLGSAAGISMAGGILGAVPHWDYVFYIFGSAMILWCTVFFIIGYSSPADNPYISDAEQTMVKQAILTTSRQKPKTIPWRRILKSTPFIALVLINAGHTWIMFFTGIQLPIYFKTVLNFDIVGSGLSAAVPYLAMWLAGMFTGIFSDMTIKRGILSTTNNRKIFAVLSNFLPLPFFVGASYAGCNKNLATVLFTLMMFFNGLTYSSLKVNAVDLSPNYAGVLMGIANGVSAFGGLLLPYFITLFVDKNNATIYDWRKVFIVSAIISVALTLPYVFLASGNVQPWNSADDELPPPPVPRDNRPTQPDS